MSNSPVPAIVALFGAALAVLGLLIGASDGAGFLLVLVGIIVAFIGTFTYLQGGRRAEYNRQLKLYEDGVIDEPPIR